MVRGLIAAGEKSAKLLAFAKLGNVALSMLWGFAVTFVFVRALPGQEFRAFLLLVAFNNFTISGEFGLTNIIYARLRRHWLRDESDGAGGSDFRAEEIGVLFLFLSGLILAASLAVAAAIVLGWIDTDLPAIFLIFFLASALNVLLLLAKRALAALDCNLLWEGVDMARRIAGLAALFAVLGGFSLLGSVAVQLLLNVSAALFGLWLIHRRTGMRRRHWLAWHVGGGHVRRTYLRDIGASAALTASEILAYNSPYFLIAALSHDPRLLLLFDFAFKMIRAVSTAIRATIESALPRLTRLWFGGDGEGFLRALLWATGVAIAVALCADALLIAIGQRIFALLYHDTTGLEMPELLSLCALLVALALMCVSVYVQGALGRFGELLRRSLPFLGGSLLVTPIAVALGGGHAGPLYMSLYAALFAAAAALHIASLAKLRRAS